MPIYDKRAKPADQAALERGLRVEGHSLRSKEEREHEIE